MYKEKLAKNLKILIGNKSIMQVAKEIGINDRTLWSYVHGEKEIGLENLVKIADYFNEEIDYLIGRKN